MDYLPLEPAEDGNDNLYSATVDVETPAQEQASVQVVYRQIQSVSPAEAIVDHARSEDVDLVVMGTHGRRGVERLLRGSVSEEVVREAPCPVFTVLADGEPSPGPYVEKVLAPVDLSDQSEMVIRHARELSRSYNASLSVLHIIENVAYPNAYGVDPLTPILPDVRSRAAEALEDLVDRARDEEIEMQAVVRTGYAAQDILEYAEEIEAGLIVMATHGRTGLERFLIGSVAEKVVRSAPCPVFTLKSFGASLVPEAPAGASSAASA
jgi:nucleotide-binding universal stress UspA family protein